MTSRSRLARLNPLTRIVVAFVVTMPLLATLDWVSATVAAGLELVAALALGVGPRWLWRRGWFLLWVAPLAGVPMLLYGDPGGTVYVHWGLVTISDQSIRFALALVARVSALALPAIVLLGDLDATDVADALTQRAHLPERFVYGTLAGVRMAGLFTEDWKTLELARRARGLGDTGRLRRLATMSFTLLVFALRRGTRLAAAMEARGFGGELPRSRARTSRTTWRDPVAVVLGVGLIAVALAAAVWAGTFHAITG